MKVKLLYLLFLVIGIIPIYHVVSWIYVFKTNPNLSQIEKQIVFYDDFCLGYRPNVFLVALFGVVSIGFFVFQLIKNQGNLFKRILLITLSLVILIFTLLNVWFML